jgi:hypothetical protein
MSRERMRRRIFQRRRLWRLDSFFKAVEQKYVKEIYCAELPAKQIRNPNLEIRNKPQPNKIKLIENSKL